MESAEGNGQHAAGGGGEGEGQGGREDSQVSEGVSLRRSTIGVHLLSDKLCPRWSMQVRH